MLCDAVDVVGQPSLWINIVEFGGLDERIHDRGTPSPGVGTSEEIILAADGNLLFILPMSGKSSRSITAGIHCMGAMFDSNTVSSVPVAGLFMLRRRPV